MNQARARFSAVTKILVGVVVAALLAAGAATVFGRAGMQTITADFTVANSVYEGSQVRILGVPVGTVTSIEPRGKVARLTLEIEGGVKIPADAKAVIVSPAVVGDRFVQLAPAYTGGPVMADGAHLGADRTEVPIELDDVYKAFNDLAVALGPNGVNKDGSLATLVHGGAVLLDGEGQNLNDTIHNFSLLSRTLGDNSDELFGSVRQISHFVQMLKQNDQVVRDFEGNTADLAKLLADERGDLAGTIKALAAALIDVRNLLQDNRSSLHANIDNLIKVTQTLSARRSELNEAGKSAPTALVNVALAYNGRFGALDARTNVLTGLLGAQGNPLDLLKTLLGQSGLSQLQGALGALGLPSLPRAPLANIERPQTLADMLGVAQ